MRTNNPIVRSYKAAAMPANAMTTPAKVPRLRLEAPPVKAVALAEGALLAPGTDGEVPFPFEMAPPVAAGIPEVAVAKPDEPEPVAL